MNKTQAKTVNKKSKMSFHFLKLWLLIIILCTIGGDLVITKCMGLACNWGTRSTHPLPPNIVVKLMKDNGFDKVKLFEAEPGPLRALGNTGIQVMLGIPNEFLESLASSVSVAEDWVSHNVSAYISRNGVDIRYVAVGNEPFLKTYKDKFLQTTLKALANIQAALIRAGLGRQVQVTVPLNADVYETTTGLPSGGDFRSDIHAPMISIIKFLSDNNAPLTINIYPFISLYMDPHFPVEYAFFPAVGTSPSPVVDGAISYTNVFDANYDTLIWALEKNGFPSMVIIVGEMGWPTDGDMRANSKLARRFNQGLINRINQGLGTPKRPTNPSDIYLFGLIDEDAKSIEPGNFERHWGIFNYDGSVKYTLDLGANHPALIQAKDVRFLARQWCIMAPEASTDDANLAPSVDYACMHADCTSLGYGSSCGALDVRSNASYAFNMYYQTMNHHQGSCEFSNLSVVTRDDPSQDTCRFEIMVDLGKHVQDPTSHVSSSPSVVYVHMLGLIMFMALICIYRE